MAKMQIIKIFKIDRVYDKMCGQIDKGHLYVRRYVKSEWEKLDTQAQRSLVNFFLHEKAGVHHVAEALKRGLNNPEIVKKFTEGEDFVLAAIKAEFKNPFFVDFVHYALSENNNDRAAQYGFKFSREEGQGLHRKIEILKR
jgi:hypothetical protein